MRRIPLIYGLPGSKAKVVRDSQRLRRPCREMSLEGHMSECGKGAEKALCDLSTKECFGSDTFWDCFFCRSVNTLCSKLKVFWGVTGPSQPDLPLWPGPSLNTSSRTRFGPDLDLKSPFSGPNQVRARCSERVRARGVGPAGMGLWVPKKVLTLCLWRFVSGEPPTSPKTPKKLK